MTRSQKSYNIFLVQHFPNENPICFLAILLLKKFKDAIKIVMEELN